MCANPSAVSNRLARNDAELESRKKVTLSPASKRDAFGCGKSKQTLSPCPELSVEQAFNSSVGWPVPPVPTKLSIAGLPDSPPE